MRRARSSRGPVEYIFAVIVITLVVFVFIHIVRHKVSQWVDSISVEVSEAVDW